LTLNDAVALDPFRDTPRQHSQVNAAEADYIERGRVIATPRGPLPSVAEAALRSRSVWFPCIMYFAQTYGFYFLLPGSQPTLRTVSPSA
jgi:ACS family glucarate transporter-like MFS transporter